MDPMEAQLISEVREAIDAFGEWLDSGSEDEEVPINLLSAIENALAEYDEEE
jgi:hypothetical protein